MLGKYNAFLPIHQMVAVHGLKNVEVANIQ